MTLMRLSSPSYDTRSTNTTTTTTANNAKQMGDYPAGSQPNSADSSLASSLSPNMSTRPQPPAAVKSPLAAVKQLQQQHQRCSFDGHDPQQQPSPPLASQKRREGEGSATAAASLLGRSVSQHAGAGASSWSGWSRSETNLTNGGAAAAGAGCSSGGPMSIIVSLNDLNEEDDVDPRGAGGMPGRPMNDLSMHRQTLNSISSEEFVGVGGTDEGQTTKAQAHQCCGCGDGMLVKR